MADHEDEFHDVVDDGEKDEEILPPEPKEGELYCLPSMSSVYTNEKIVYLFNFISQSITILDNRLACLQKCLENNHMDCTIANISSLIH